MALGYVTSPNTKGTVYAHKTRIDKVVNNGDIATCLHGVSRYLTEDMLYDFMLEAKIQGAEYSKIKKLPFKVANCLLVII